MNNQSCSKCSKKLPTGSLKYILSIKLYADFDGDIEKPVETDIEKDMDDLDYLIKCLGDSKQEEMENDVHREMAFLLCKGCRDSFSKNPLNKREGSHDSNGYLGILH